MIKISSSPSGITKVYQDGNELHGIKEVRFTQNAMDNVPHLLIEFAGDNVEMDLNIIPELPEFYKRFYKKRADLIQDQLF